MMHTNCYCLWLAYTALVVCLTVTKSTSHGSRITYNSPGIWNYGSTSNSMPQMNDSKGETHYRPQIIPQIHNINTSNQQTDQAFYPWPLKIAAHNNYPPAPQRINTRSRWNPGNNNNYHPTPQSGNRWPVWNPGNNNNYPTTPQPGNRWPVWSPGNNDYPQTPQPSNRWPNWNPDNHNNYPTTPQPGNRWPVWNPGNNNYPQTPQPSNRWPNWNPGNHNNYPTTPHPGNRWPTWNPGNNNNYPFTPQPGNRWPTWNPGNHNNYPITRRPDNHWPTMNPGNHNNYPTRPQPGKRWPPWNPGNNNNYSTTSQPGNRWSNRPPNSSFTQATSLTRSFSMEPPIDRGEQFDLIDFHNLPDSYKTAFMSVEGLLKNNGMISPPGPNSGNVVVVFDTQTHRILDPSLAPIVSNILPTLVPGTWRSMTYIQGCCSALRYHAANETLLNVSGQPKKIVHFSKYNPPMYQFIPHGLCAHASYSTNGHCIQGTVTMSLLIYDLRFNPPISFDFFSIPSYCNCVQY